LHDRLADRLDGGAPNITRTVECLAQNIALSVNALSQVAGVVAFDSTEELEAVKAGYAVNRALACCRFRGQQVKLA
jgi:hypothetical protein